MSTEQVFSDVAGLSKRYMSSGRLAIESVTLGVGSAKFAPIVGPSGCGKTTLLKTICALLQPTAGTVTLAGRLVTTPPLLVTHDIDETVYLSDRIFVLSPSPSIVIRAFDIQLGGTRDQERTRSEPAFLALCNETHHLIGRPRPAAKESV